MINKREFQESKVENKHFQNCSLLSKLLVIISYGCGNILLLVIMLILHTLYNIVNNAVPIMWLTMLTNALSTPLHFHVEFDSLIKKKKT